MTTHTALSEHDTTSKDRPNKDTRPVSEQVNQTKLQTKLLKQHRYTAAMKRTIPPTLNRKIICWNMQPATQRSHTLYSLISRLAQFGSVRTAHCFVWHIAVLSVPPSISSDTVRFCPYRPAVPHSGHDRFLPNPLPFIPRHSPCRKTLRVRHYEYCWQCKWIFR